jgi:hypothetical protein
MKLKIKKRPTCMYVHMHIYIVRKLQRIRLNFFFNFLQKKKNFLTFELTFESETSEFSDVSLFKRQKSFFFFFSSLLFFFYSLLDIWLKILFNFLIKSFKI